MDEVDHRRVKPDADESRRCFDALAHFDALANDGARFHVAGLARVDELIALDVAHLGAQAAYLLRHQQTHDLGRIGRTGGVVLHRVQEGDIGPGPVGQDYAVAGGAVMIGGGKVLVM